MDNEFKLEHQVTIGVEFGSFACKIEDKVVKLQIWDTAGQESFRSITRIFYRGAHCVFLTYDITRDETFVNVKEWLMEVKQHASSDILIYLIGNRSDLEDEREVQQEKAIEFCKQYQIDKFFETSAKTGDHVEEVFSLASKELYIAQKESQEEEQATGGTTGQPQTDDGSQDQTGQRSAQPKKVKLNKRTSGQKVQKGGEKNQNCC